MIKGYWSAPVVFAGFLALIFAVKLFKKLARIPSARKAFHTANGVMCLTLPWLSERWEPIALASAVAAVFLAALRMYKRRHGGRCDFLYDTSGLDSFGEVLFPVTVLILSVITRLEPLAFIAPIAVLTFADSAAALVGVRFGHTDISIITGNKKTLAGTHTFFAVSFVSLLVLLRFFAGGSLVSAMLISATVSIAAATVELISSHGTDNLTVPLTVWILIRFLPGADLCALLLLFAAAAMLPLSVTAVRQIKNVSPFAAVCRPSLDEIRKEG